MLERIRLTNFQCHAELKIGLKESILAVVGDSDKGKSTLCRAIRWLALNKPRGSGFIRWGQKLCSVKIRLDGHDIERIRDSTGNRYVFGGKEYKAAGNDVPGDIRAFLAMGPENFQQQHDSPFWFGLTPGELGKELNKIVDMEIIDTAIGNVASRLRKGRATEDVCEQRLAQAEDRAEELGWVPRYVEECNQLVDLEKAAEQAEFDVDDLEEFCRELAECRETIETARDYVEAGQNVLELGSEYEKSMQDYQELRGLLAEIGEKQSEIERNRYNVDEARKTLDQESEGLCPICGNELKGI